MTENIELIFSEIESQYVEEAVNEGKRPVHP